MQKSTLARQMSLQDMRRTNFFKEIEQPDTVYHMTSREAAKQILQDQRVRTMKDYVCFFFTDTADIPVYIKLTNADEGRKFYDYSEFTGRPFINTAPPLIRSETVILKLKPRYKEQGWFKEVNQDKAADEMQQEIIDKFDSCRVLHYGDFKFRTLPSDIEIIELTDIC